MYTGCMKENKINKSLVILTIIAFSVFGLYSATTGKNLNTSKKDAIASTVSDSVFSDIHKGATLIDVRTAEEYDVDHAIGAINIPLSDIQTGKIPSIKKDSPIYLYCHSGARADVSRVLLEKAGYSKVVSLRTLYNWVSMGGEVTGTASICKINKPENC